MLKLCILVGMGGALGAIFRYFTYRSLGFTLSGFPLGTFIVNIVGCLLIGVSWALLVDEKHNLTRLFVITGFLGGFTTFSSFGWESFQLFQDGKWKLALTYIFSSNFIGLILLVAGFVLVKKLKGV
ncbi:MAG: fluoride efflux transporter CrcB [Saprospiraceae bacterium]|nr:fluoride efflux transporter CrcB [Saprospiraceae bacterium]